MSSFNRWLKGQTDFKPVSCMPAALPTKDGEIGMLVLARRTGEVICIDLDGTKVEVSVQEICGDRIRLGFRAPKRVRILRKEIIRDELANNDVRTVRGGQAGEATGSGESTGSEGKRSCDQPESCRESCSETAREASGVCDASASTRQA